MWDILLQAAAAFVVGAAVGYGFATIVEALSTAFSKLWENLVIASQEIYCNRTNCIISHHNWR